MVKRAVDCGDRFQVCLPMGRSPADGEKSGDISPVVPLDDELEGSRYRIISQDEAPVQKKRGRKKNSARSKGAEEETQPQPEVVVVQQQEAHTRTSESSSSATRPRSDKEEGLRLVRARRDELNRKIEKAMDQFLEGEFAGFASDSPMPRYGQTPEEVVQIMLNALKQPNNPTANHGYAVALKFCTPLAIYDRLRPHAQPWRELVRRSPSPKVFASRIRSSPFSVLGRWDQLHIQAAPEALQSTTSTGSPTTVLMEHDIMVDLTLEDVSPRQVQLLVNLKKATGVWLIDQITITRDSLLDTK